MSFMKRFQGLFAQDNEDNDEENSEYEDEEVESEDSEYEDVQEEPVKSPAKKSESKKQTININNISSTASHSEMKLFRPDKYDMVTSIAQYLMNSGTVLLNLEDVDKETERHIFDFLSGSAFALGASLQKISPSTYVIAPHFVNVVGIPGNNSEVE